MFGNYYDAYTVEIRNRACGFAGYKCSKSMATYAMLLILLSKIATRNHMTSDVLGWAWA